MKNEFFDLTKTLIAIIVVLIIAGMQTSVRGETLSTIVDPDREVIAMFKPGIVSPPDGKTKGLLNEFHITSDTLRQILENADVEEVSRLIPDFQSEDRFTVSRTGESVVLTDWANVYLLRIPVSQYREALLTALGNRPEVVYSEPNGRGEPDLDPNDVLFFRQWALKNEGTGYQGNGTPGADIKATQAWDITTGSDNIKIAIVDGGMQTNHPDFTGRVTGDDGDNDAHGTAVAGIAAAQGNNIIGIAGVAWNVGIINEDYGEASDADFANAVISAANRGAHVINNSWKLVPVGRYSTTVRAAFADAYKLNIAAMASMGNQYSEVVQYPAAFGQGIITVGATTNTDVKADYSSTGNWIDVSAPGGGGFGLQNETEDFIYSTGPYSTYNWAGEGTSFSTPHVSGLAGLLLSFDSNLYNDDIEQIIRLGVDDKGELGFDTWYGTGRINAQKAFELFKCPYYFAQCSASGGYEQSHTDNFVMTFYGVPGLDAGNYIVKRYDVRKNVTFPHTYYSVPYVWGRGAATQGYSADNPNFGMGWCGSVDGSITTTGCVLQTYVYDVYKIFGQHIGWVPCQPSDVSFSYSVLGDIVLQVPPDLYAGYCVFYPPTIVVVWDDVNLNEQGYKVERKQGSTANPWEEIAATEPDVDYYYDSEILGSEHYRYRVRAYNQNQLSDPTEIAYITTPPNRPENPRAKVYTYSPNGDTLIYKTDPGDPIDPTFRSTNRVTFIWDEPQNQKPGSISHYQLHVWGERWYQVFDSIYSTSTTQCMPETECLYQFKVFTRDYNEEISSPSEIETVTTGNYMICEPDTRGSINRYINPPLTFDLLGNFPNPFNPKTNIAFNLPEPSEVYLKIYNITGQLVRSYRNWFDAGEHSIIWDGKNDDGFDVASGIYLYRIFAGERSAVEKMVLIR